MSKCRHIIRMICLLLTIASDAMTGSAATTIVPEKDAVCDDRARIALVQALLRTAEGRHEAIEHVSVLQERDLSAADMQMDVADIQTALGHYRAAHALYGQVISHSRQSNAQWEERLAGHRLLWGDFYGAERFWRGVLENNPDDIEASLRLGAVLVGADRYDDAEAIYRKLWVRPPHNQEAALELARVHLLQRRFNEAQQLARELLLVPAVRRDATILLGQSLQGLGELQEAEALFAGLATDDAAGAGDWVRLGVVQFKLGDEQRGSESFAAALERDPNQIEALFRLAGKATIDSDDFMQGLFAREANPARLRQWADLYIMEGFRQRALACYEQALQIDPDYFPAAEGRAFVLAISGEHKNAAKSYRALISGFQESRKLRVSLARTLAWGRQYDESLNEFETLIEEYPHDLLLQREAARVALWGKALDHAMDRYDRILAPSVDEQLYDALLTITDDLPSDHLEALQRLAQDKQEGSGHDGFADWISRADNNELTDEAADIVADLSGVYALHRAVFLEREYKRLQWRHRYARAQREVSKLIALTPGDQEAVFDRAQLSCIQGLCNHARADYEYLLQLDPTHSIAVEALDLARLDAHPGLRMDGSYWNERGRGGLSDLQRYTTGLGLDIPVYCLTALFAHYRRSTETPGDSGRIDSWSQTIGFRGVFSPYLKGDLHWTRKQYDQAQYRDTHTGQIALWANLNDYAHLGAGLERKDELYNRFGFAKKTQSDNTWIELKSDLTRRWDAAVRLRDIRYNDNNRGHSIFLNTGFDVTDHPGIFNVALSAQHRSTAYRSQYRFDAENNLTDIVHPYWTPRDYWGFYLTLEWWHDISGPHQYCGNRRHFYDIKATFSTDTESNPGITLEAEWQYRFTRRCFAGLNAYMHRSREWDAEGLWLSLGCQF